MKKVTVITACYNGERFVDAYAHTLLAQTYQDVEILFVDDGSTDGSAEKIKSYARAFREKGMDFQYFYQENQGQAAATNTAFQHMTGDYFMLHDIDDLLEGECIQERAAFLGNHPACGMVYSKIWRQTENEKQKTEYGILTAQEESNIFEKIISLQQDVLPIRYMFRTVDFDKINGKRRIFASRATQDVQIVLPMAYYYKAAFLPKCLSTYVVHEDSHYHCYMDRCESYEKKIERWDELEEVWRESIRSIKAMPPDERHMLLARNHQHFAGNRQKELVFMLWNKIDVDLQENKVILFSAGVAGKETARLLRQRGLDIVCFCDNNQKNWGKLLDGIEIREFTKGLLDYEKGSIVLITLRASNAGMKEIVDQLQGLGLETRKDYYYYLDFMMEKVYDEMRYAFTEVYGKEI